MEQRVLEKNQAGEGGQREKKWSCHLIFKVQGRFFQEVAMKDEALSLCAFLGKAFPSKGTMKCPNPKTGEEFHVDILGVKK